MLHKQLAGYVMCECNGCKYKQQMLRLILWIESGDRRMLRYQYISFFVSRYGSKFGVKMHDMRFSEVSVKLMKAYGKIRQEALQRLKGSFKLITLKSSSAFASIHRYNELKAKIHHESFTTLLLNILQITALHSFTHLITAQTLIFTECSISLMQ